MQFDELNGKELVLLLDCALEIETIIDEDRLRLISK